MPVPAAALPNPSPIFAWKRVRVVLIACFVISLIALLRPVSYPGTVLRLLLVGAVELAVFGLFERWPQRLPSWIARWGLQVAGVAFVLPFAMAIAYWLTSDSSAGPWYHNESKMKGYALLTMLGLLSAPWIAVAALLRQIRDEARQQALAFELERSEFERKTLAAQLRLLQAQVEPHFLFNTLANVRELVETGSAQAGPVLDSLIAYLRAAVPRLQSGSNTLEQEFDLARAYLELMQMRMPDRLAYTLQLDPAAAALDCPPMLLLTLVENAVRHGIDPSVTGGRIDVTASRQGGRCCIEVRDSGIGLGPSKPGLGTGLATLRERLRLHYGEDTRLELRPNMPQGASAILEFPTTQSSA